MREALILMREALILMREALILMRGALIPMREALIRMREGRLAVPILAEQHDARLGVHRQLGVAEEGCVGARVSERDAAQLHTKAVDLASRLEIQGSQQRCGEHLHARKVISGNLRTLRFRGSSTSSCSAASSSFSASSSSSSLSA